MKACRLIRHLCFGLILIPCFTSGQSDDHSISSNVPLNEISTRACRQFYRLFPKADLGQYWYACSDGYQVSFTEKGVHYQAWFDPRGGYRYSLHYYAGKDIPREPGDLLRRKYPDYQINVVTEITDGDRVVYLVRMVSATSIKTISVCEGEIEVIEQQAIASPAMTALNSLRYAP